SRAHPPPLSFPTRRSSDLALGEDSAPCPATVPNPESRDPSGFPGYGRRMRVVVAPDKFKGSATAAEAAAALATGLRRVRPDLDVAEVPVADGGDGTVAAALAAGFAPVRTTAEGPAGEPV